MAQGMWGTKQEHMNIPGNVGCQGSTQLVKELIQRKGRATARLLRQQQNHTEALSLRTLMFHFKGTHGAVVSPSEPSALTA